LTFDVATATYGTEYKVELAVENEHGIGAYSDPVKKTIYAAPAVPAAITQSYDTSNVKLVWAAPASNGKAITAYKV
jgi:hypothetical protein